MKLTYKLTFEDLLLQHLYSYSIIGSVVKYTQKVRFMYGLPALIAFAFILYNWNDGYRSMLIMYALFAGMALMVVFARRYAKKIFEKTASKHIVKNQSYLLTETASLELSADIILSETSLGKAEFSYKSVEFIHRLEQYFYIRFIGAVSMIIPISAIKNQDLLIELFEKNGVEFKEMKDWIW